MLSTLIKKELLDNLLSFRFIITLLLCLVLIPLGIFVSIKEYENARADYQQSLGLVRDASQGMRNAIDVEAKGLRPPSPFSIFAEGLDKVLPNEILSTRNEGLSLGNNRSMDDPLSVLFGKMDFLFIVGVVMSLLAILFTFDATTREKEGGTLRLALANAIPRHRLLVGKIFGNFITFLIPFILAILISITILLLTGIIPLFQSGNLLRLGIIIGIAILFIFIFFNLGLMISSLTHNSMTSQITLMFIWVLVVFALPRASGMMARIVYPVKTQQTINLEKTLVRKQIEDEKAEALRDIFLRRRQLDTDETQPSYAEMREPIVQALNEKKQRLLEAIERDHLARKNTQIRIATILSRLSPLASLTFAITEMSNTGIWEMENVYNSANEFHDTVIREVHSKGYKDDIPGTGMRMNMAYINMESIPQYQIYAVSVGQGIHAGWVDILLLTLFNIVLFSGAYVAFLRYDVR